MGHPPPLSSKATRPAVAAAERGTSSPPSCRSWCWCHQEPRSVPGSPAHPHRCLSPTSMSPRVLGSSCGLSQRQHCLAGKWKKPKGFGAGRFQQPPARPQAPLSPHSLLRFNTHLAQDIKPPKHQPPVPLGAAQSRKEPPKVGSPHTCPGDADPSGAGHGCSPQTCWAKSPPGPSCTVTREWGLAEPEQHGKGQWRLVGTTHTWVEDDSPVCPSMGQFQSWRDLSGHLENAVSLSQDSQSLPGEAGTGRTRHAATEGLQ